MVRREYDDKQVSTPEQTEVLASKHVLMALVLTLLHSSL